MALSQVRGAAGIGSYESILTGLRHPCTSAGLPLPLGKRFGAEATAEQPIPDYFFKP